MVAEIPRRLDGYCKIRLRLDVSREIRGISVCRVWHSIRLVLLVNSYVLASYVCIGGCSVRWQSEPARTDTQPTRPPKDGMRLWGRSKNSNPAITRARLFWPMKIPSNVTFSEKILHTTSQFQYIFIGYDTGSMPPSCAARLVKVQYRSRKFSPHQIPR